MLVPAGLPRPNCPPAVAAVTCSGDSAGGGGEEQSCRVECFAYNKHSREILLILLDIFPMYVRVLIKHFSQKPSEAGVFYSTKFMIFLLDSLVSSTNKNKDWKCIYPVAICKMSLVFMRHKK